MQTSTEPMREPPGSGLPGLDRVLLGLRAGDNVVWETDAIPDYLPFVGPFCAEARRQGKPVCYLRFARHAPLLQGDCGAQILQLDPADGFERFLECTLEAVERAGPDACLVFDSLSELAEDWYSDRMLGNFFRIACPFVFRMGSVGYFALRKNLHSFHATDAIFATAQIIFEVYRGRDRLFVHPLKVAGRHTPSMNMLHSWEPTGEFLPVTSSAATAEILASVPKPWLDFALHRPGVWARTSQRAERTVRAMREGAPPPFSPDAMFARVRRMLVTRDPRMAELADRYFDLADLVNILQRMIGTGLIGGKSLGMLLARAALRKARPQWDTLLESHDSFYIGSDVFYTYLVENDCWWLRRRPRSFDRYLAQAREAREKILGGAFPDYILHEFREMLEYFGQFPLIVRSSSLLEDNYGNAFSGKYESVFCANQGTPAERLEAFLNAVRTVYASAFREEGLLYRRHHGLLDRDEQMALLIQRVSGDLHGRLFFPHVAGVGFSFNPFVWSEEIDPHAGMLRLVFGLGTRAVDRADDDYTRLVALNAPLRSPEEKPGENSGYTQRKVDVLDLEHNRLAHLNWETAAACVDAATLEWFAADAAAADSTGKGPAGPGRLDFGRLFEQTDFAATMRELCRTLETIYRHPVDIEFTANFSARGKFRIHLLQCRPFQVKVGAKGSRVALPQTIPHTDLLFRSSGPVVGHSLATVVDRVIYVVPSVFSQLPMSRRFSVARAIGRLTHLEGPEKRGTIMLIGPGRWGTSMASLGVPVSFAEINTVTVICELALMHDGLIPDVSLGTHFFNDLVEMDMLYLSIAPDRQGHELNDALILGSPNRLPELLPSAAKLAPVLHVADTNRPREGDVLLLNVDSMKQRAACYRQPKVR